MDDPTTAARKRRREKILATAGSRLSRISQLSNDDNHSCKPYISHVNQIDNFVNSTTEPKRENLCTEEVPPIIPSTNDGTLHAESTPITLTNKYWIIPTAFMTFLLFKLNMGHLFCENALIPWMLGEISVRGLTLSFNNRISPLVLPKWIPTILLCYQIFNDLVFYIFTIIFLHVFVN